MSGAQAPVLEPRSGEIAPSSSGGLDLSVTDIVLAVLLFLGLLVLIFFIVRRWWDQRGRGQALAAYAREHGLQYVPRNDAIVRPAGFPFGVGRNRRAENVLLGDMDEYRMLAYDYVFETGHAGTHRTHRFGVVLIRLPAPLPELEVVEEEPTTEIELQDVTLGSAEFDDRFFVRAADRRLAYAVLHPQTVLALLARPRIAVRTIGLEAMSWKPGRLGVNDVEEHLNCLHALVHRIPDAVWQERRRPA